ncbi:MAG: anthranilate synthase component I [Chromatiales bacterium]|nr:anthranilate synthase component I [Chromatiales bacterium]
MDHNEYQRLAAQGYTHIPLVRELPADLDTPVGVYLKLANSPNSYLLESADEGRYWGRYSIIGMSCSNYIQVNHLTVSLYEGGCLSMQQEVSNPLSWVEDYLATFNIAQSKSLPRFCGGLVGYFSYETACYIEPKLATATLKKPDELATPDIFLMVSMQIAVIDNLRGMLSLIVYADTSHEDGYQQALDTIQELEGRLRTPSVSLPSVAVQVPNERDFSFGFTQSDYMDAVEKCRRYIIDGEVMQVALSQRMQAPFECNAFNLYRALRRLNPSPYMFYFNLDEFNIVGSSPEILVRKETEQLTLRPIAGTRRRGETDAEDLRLEKELLSDDKELAEHLMLIDLGRNDLGRVAKVGSVQVTDKMLIERYSHVMHIVSNVVGVASPNTSAVEVLRATFPAGTVTGAPKVRAMEIIAELEPVKRNIYSGAVGYIGWNGIMDLAIAIRTAVIKEQTLFVQTGAGLVYDSQPQKEWLETMNKADVLLAAARMAKDFA